MFENHSQNFFKNELERIYKYQSEFNILNTKDLELKTIFIAIACYRDDELLPTVLSAIKNAKNPERLKFGISIIYQKDSDDIFWKDLESLSNVKFLIKEDTLENVGLGKQRDDANSFYNNEDYYFQIDSHMRFDLYWDDLLIHHIEGIRALGEDKPVITGYPRGYVSDKQPFAEGYFPYYNPITSEIYFKEHRGHNNIPCMRSGLRSRQFFKDTGFIRHGDRRFGEFEALAITAAVSPAQIFADGKFLKDVPADRSLRFLEEEQYYSILAFMKGYNFYVPRVTGVMHYYTEDYANNTVSPRPSTSDLYPNVFSIESYFEGNLEGKDLILNLANIKNPVRTFAEYEKFARVDYSTREILSPVDKRIVNDKINYINFLAENYTYSTNDYINWFNEPDYYWKKDIERNAREKNS